MPSTSFPSGPRIAKLCAAKIPASATCLLSRPASAESCCSGANTALTAPCSPPKIACTPAAARPSWPRPGIALPAMPSRPPRAPAAPPKPPLPPAAAAASPAPRSCCDSIVNASPSPWMPRRRASMVLASPSKPRCVSGDGGGMLGAGMFIPRFSISAITARMRARSRSSG